MANTTVIGCFHDYDYEQIKPWINSLKRTGFSGDICLVVLRGKYELVKKLNKQGITIFSQEPDDNGNIEFSPGVSAENSMSVRFGICANFIRNYCKSKNVVFADVKDVIFQSNPEELFNSYQDSHIIVAEEGFKYIDEPWSKNNMISSYGDPYYERMKNISIVCAGVIAGKKDFVADLFDNIYAWCSISNYTGTVPGGGGPDQSALNIILNQRLYSVVTQKTRHILHAGTSIPGIKAGHSDIGLDVKNNPEKMKIYEDLFGLSSYPILNSEGQIINENNGNPYIIVHQYDRIPEWKKIILEKYKD